jgi:hypothetical protein
MKRRVMFAGVAAIAGLLVPLAAAAPSADAGTGVGCVGSQCSVSVWQFVKLSGSVGTNGGGDTVPIDVQPPPCLWDPIGDATTGSQYIISQFGSVTQQDSLFDVYQSVQQAKKLLANPTAGTWYELPVNPNASPAGQAECAKLPLFAFVPPGQTPPMPNVPARDLAEYAYNHMFIPKPVVTTSPALKGWVNLATYVHLNTPRQVTISATLGNETVTVTARPVKTTISGSSAGTPYSDCGLKGSRYRGAPTTGAGVPPDCGVLWQAPTTDGSVTATVTWNVTWGGAGGGGTLPDVVLNGTKGGLRVAEIQSVNGTGSGN